MRPHFASCFQKNGRPAAKREGVAYLQAALGLSERRACSIVNADRKMIPDTSISGRRVARELTALIDQRGKPGVRYG
jgi:hypothetical protein